MTKRDVTGALVWLRNGIAFAFTWLALLILVFCRLRGIKSISVDTLLRLFVFVCGGVLLFCLWFSPGIWKKTRFFTRLTCFFLTFTPFEFLGFYRIGLFTRDETTLPRVLGFLGIVLIFYLLCLWIDRSVCARWGEKYTESLKRYQQREENDQNDRR